MPNNKNTFTVELTLGNAMRFDQLLKAKYADERYYAEREPKTTEDGTVEELSTWEQSAKAKAIQARQDISDLYQVIFGEPLRDPD